MTDLLVEITDLTELASVVAADDQLVIVDKSDLTQSVEGSTKRMGAQTLRTALFAGFGTADPITSGALTVTTGGAAITGNSTVTGTLTVTSTLTAQANVVLSNTFSLIWGATTAYISGSSASNYLRFYTSNTQQVNIDSAGAVILGTDPGGSDRFRVGGATTLSSGSDANTQLTVGTGGASPTASRNAVVALKVPDSSGNRGTARVDFYRDSTNVFGLGIRSAVAGAMANLSDLAFTEQNGGTVVGALTQSGQLRTSGGFQTSSTVGLTMAGATARIYWNAATSAWMDYSSATFTLRNENGTTVYTATNSLTTIPINVRLTTATAATYEFYNANYGIRVTNASGITEFISNAVSYLTVANNGATSTFSAGTDASTTLVAGGGGGSPTANRSARLWLDAPSSGGNLGIAYISFSRNGSVIWDAGVNHVTSGGAKSAATDFYWHNGSDYQAALTTAGQLRLAHSVVVLAGAVPFSATVAADTDSAAVISNNTSGTTRTIRLGVAAGGGTGGYVGTTTNDLLELRTNNSVRVVIDTSGNVLVGGAVASTGTPGLNVRTASANDISYAVSWQQVNTGTSAGVGERFTLADSTSVLKHAGGIYVQKAAAWTNGTAATFDAQMIMQVLINDAMTTILTLDGNASTPLMTVAGAIKTNDPGGGAGNWRLGIANAVSPTAPNRTVTIDIGGTVIYLHGKTTND